MKKSTYTVLLMLALALLAATPGTVAEEPAAAPVPDGAPAVEVAAPVAAACPALDAADVLGPSLQRHCPFGAPECRKDDHCDAFCGDPRFGICLSDGCCGCTG